MRAGDWVFCDTNVLLSAVSRGRHNQAKAQRVLNELPNHGIELCISGQVIREYLAVATRPREANGLGQRYAHAVDNINMVSARARVLEETLEVAQRLLKVAQEAKAIGKQVHDANIVATMLEHGVRFLVTSNPGDFKRYNTYVEVVDLSEIE